MKIKNMKIQHTKIFNMKISWSIW